MTHDTPAPRLTAAEYRRYLADRNPPATQQELDQLEWLVEIEARAARLKTEAEAWAAADSAIKRAGAPQEGG